ncbi:MAG: hypothetical protein AMK72_08935 [Planctomycetes bacterium SM23_25]|nr:MAG: hypothetical protein AMK72_08935 [Planctomycetes bacterium SM23_25]
MRTKTMTGICVALVAMAIGASSVWAAKEKAPETPLTEAGQKLLERYTGMLTELQAEVSKALPTVDEQKKSAYLKGREAEKAADTEVKAAQQRLGKIATAQALVNHAKGKWIGGAEKGIAEAQAKLKKATTQAERNAAHEELVKWQKNRKDGIEALKQRQEALDKANREKPKVEQELRKAEGALAQAKAKTMAAIRDLGLTSLLSSDKLDANLAKYVVLLEATPRGLAEFAQQGKEHEQLVGRLLAGADLMLQMVVADGAKDGRYGQAMKIYTDIQKASTKASGGVLQRLALAISLEHAVPVSQRNPEAQTDAPATVNPVNRYLHFEKAFLGGGLDPGFEGLSVWDLRMVVDGNEPDEILAWGREMLRNYRPDHISTSDYRWRYVAAVRTDIKYGSQDNKYDKPELQFFQNILMNGGVCGRRAFFGRFILRAFGVPTTARPQRGHAALAHWTPDGWVVCLGGGWGVGWVNGRNKDLDFLAITQARNSEKAFLQVKRAQWIGDVMGEKRTFGFLSGDPAFWNGVALYVQRAIIEDAKAETLAAVGEDIGEANESKEEHVIEDVTVTEEDSKTAVGAGGVITVPAVACSKPTSSTAKIVFMKSHLGGMQLHYNRLGAPEQFEYIFDVPTAGKYALTARVVTPSWQQHLLVAVNDAKEPIDIALPFTVGMWDKTQPVMVSLVKGRNVLRFSRNEPVKGLTIKEFTLKPLNY